MIRVAFCLALFALLAFDPTAHADIVYSLQNYPSFQNGYFIAGTVTTNGKIGPIISSDITRWSVDVTAPSGAVTHTDSGMPIASVFLLGTLNATANEITIGTRSNGTNQLEFVGPPKILNYVRAISGNTYQGNADVPAWNTHPSNTDLGGDPWIIARATVIPEPSSLAMTSAIVAGALALLRSDRERRLRPSVIG